MRTVLVLLLLLLAVMIVGPIVFVGCVQSDAPEPAGEKVVGTLQLPNGQVIPLTFTVVHGDEPIVVEPTTAAQALDDAKSRARLWLQQL